MSVGFPVWFFSPFHLLIVQCDRGEVEQSWSMARRRPEFVLTILSARKRIMDAGAMLRICFWDKSYSQFQ
jgi:hypothetical protein